jgi:hypothetical protein
MREDKERAADYHIKSPSGKGERDGSDQPLTGPNHWWRAAEKGALPCGNYFNFCRGHV